MEEEIRIEEGKLKITFGNGYSIEINLGVDTKSNHFIVNPECDFYASKDAALTIFDPQGNIITGEWSEMEEDTVESLEPDWIAEAIYWTRCQRRIA